MHRRDFLGVSGAGVAGVSLGLKGVRSPAVHANRAHDVAVIGAGVFGVWTAYHLARSGASVVLIDAYGPGNTRASSGGETRQMQANGSSPVYTRSAINSYRWWKDIERESGVPIVLETGQIRLSTTDDNRGLADEMKSRHADYGLLEVEILEQDDVRRRWPQIHSDDIRWATYSEGVGGCLILARRAVDLVANEMVKAGGELRIARCTPTIANDRLVDVSTQDGETIEAGHYVFASGPWLPKLFPELLGNRLRVQRRDVLFYGSPPGDSSFAYPNMPTWAVFGSGYYGFPDVEHRGFKVAPYPDYNTIDPDVDERMILPQQVKRGRAFLQGRFPKLTDMPVTETRVCQVTNTVDSDFIVDRHPGVENVWIAGGGSGLGFKHGPTVGEHMAALITGGSVDEEARQTFTAMKDEFE